MVDKRILVNQNGDVETVERPHGDLVQTWPTTIKRTHVDDRSMIAETKFALSELSWTGVEPFYHDERITRAEALQFIFEKAKQP